jgi:hypothetical protein
MASDADLQASAGRNESVAMKAPQAGHAAAVAAQATVLPGIDKVEPRSRVSLPATADRLSSDRFRVFFGKGFSPMKLRSNLLGSALMAATAFVGGCSSANKSATTEPPPPITTSTASRSTSTTTTTKTEPDGTVIKETTTTTIENGRIAQKQVTTTYEYPAR